MTSRQHRIDKENVKPLRLQRPDNKMFRKNYTQHRAHVPSMKEAQEIFQHTEDVPTRLSLEEAEPSSPSLNCSSLLELS
jgi:hypothetical protein